MIAAAGTGVARRRFRMPLSRWAVTEMTRLMNEAAMIPSVMMPGHVGDRGLDPPAGTLTVWLPPNTEAKMTRNSTGRARVKNCA